MNISKSRYQRFLHCSRDLWLSIHQPEQEEAQAGNGPEPTQFGLTVGEAAKQYLGETVDVTSYREDGSLDIAAMLRRTKELMELGVHAIAEAAFVAEGCYCAVDLLMRDGDCWRIYEVKGSTEDEGQDIHNEAYLTDIAFQRWVLGKAGVRVSETHLLCVCRDYVRSAELDIRQLFNDSLVDDLIEPYLAEVEDNVREAKRMLQGGEPEEEAPTANCKDCEYWCHCMAHLPEHNVFDIAGMQYRTKLRHYTDGLITYRQLYEADCLNPKFRKVVEGELKGTAFIDKQAIRAFLSTVRYPLYHLDFETMQPPIPLFEGTWPYQQIPFQYSLHIQKEACGPTEHREFLAESGANPLRAIAESLVRDIPADVCTIAYNKAFEQTRLRELADMFPDLSDHLLAIRDNMIDLYDPFKAKDYYLPAMQGSYSIKYVLPALFPSDPELDYHNLEDVHNGGEAMTIFPQIQYMEPERAQRVRANLLKYCCLDTYAMVKVLSKLYEVAR